MSVPPVYQDAAGFVNFQSVIEGMKEVHSSIRYLHGKEYPSSSSYMQNNGRGRGGYPNVYSIHTGHTINIGSSGPSQGSEKEKKESRDRWHAFLAIIGMVGSSLCIGWTYHKEYKAYKALQHDIDKALKLVFQDEDFNAITQPLTKLFPSSSRDVRIKTVFHRGEHSEGINIEQNKKALEWTEKTCTELLKIRDAALERIQYQKGVLWGLTATLAGSVCVLTGALIGVTAFKVIGVVEITLALCSLCIMACGDYINATLNEQDFRKQMDLLNPSSIKKGEGEGEEGEVETRVNLTEIQWMWMPQNLPPALPEGQ